jgi:hypothetical protein
MTDQRLNETVSVRISTRQRDAFNRWLALPAVGPATPSNCSAFMRVASVLLKLQLASVRVYASQKLGKIKTASNRGDLVAGMALASLLDSEEISIRYRRLETHWLWVVTGMMFVSFGTAKATGNGVGLADFAQAIRVAPECLSDPEELLKFEDNNRTGILYWLHHESV